MVFNIRRVCSRNYTKKNRAASSSQLHPLQGHSSAEELVKAQENLNRNACIRFNLRFPRFYILKELLFGRSCL